MGTARRRRRYGVYIDAVLRPDGDAPEVTRLAPYTALQTSREGRATLYLCRNFACEAPTSDVTSVVEKLTAGARVAPR